MVLVQYVINANLRQADFEKSCAGKIHQLTPCCGPGAGAHFWNMQKGKVKKKKKRVILKEGSSLIRVVFHQEIIQNSVDPNGLCYFKC